MASNYTGNPTGVQTPSSAPAPGVAPIIVIPAGTDPSTIESITQQMKVGADFIAWLTQTSYAPGFFGDRSDGALVFDGTSTVLGLVPSTGVYTMTRDIFAASIALTGATTVLKTNGFRIFCGGVLSTAGGASISASGVSSTSQTGAAAGNNGTLMGGTAGGNGSSSGVGSAGGNVTLFGYSAAGGAGGTGNGGAQAGGVAGTVAGAPPANVGQPRIYAPPTFGFLVGNNPAGTGVIFPLGPGSGGGGGGAFSASSGGGGAGGGILAVAARTISLANATDLVAKGGNGANASNTNNGGGGGGGGGTMLLAYASITIGSGSLSAATNCAGGTGGTNTGTGVAGAAGATGTLFQLAMA